MAPYLDDGIIAGADAPEYSRPDYSRPGSTGYNVPQNLTWMDPQNRKLRVLTIGTGISGILMAYQIQKKCQNVEHVLYEKNHDIGGMRNPLAIPARANECVKALGWRTAILVQAVIFPVMRIRINLPWYGEDAPLWAFQG